MDHYRTLGLRSDATKEEIKEAFRSSALQFHPDRHSQSSQEVRDGASRRFRQASEAYEVLIDDRRRADYDLGCRVGRGGGASSSNHGAPRYGYGGSGGGVYSRPPPGKTVVSGLDFGFVFRYLTRRGFLVNVAFAGALLGGAAVIERSVESVWKINNSGKSFEEAMESIEKVKVQNESSRGSEDPLIPGFSGDPP